MLLQDIFTLLGAIALFLYGLKLLSSGVENLISGGVSKWVKGATKNRFGAFLAGTLCTAVAQSSIATNMIVITFAQKGVISFLSACALIMGTNVGTTITAQLVSLSTLSEFKITAIGSAVAFIGLILNLLNGTKQKALGKAFIGFGFVFMGINLLSDSVESFKRYSWFTNLFLVKNPLLLLINGFIITAVLQSSSVVTSVMIVLASLNLMNFSSATFIILGANVGTCLPVIYSSAKMGESAKKSAIFNLIFNIFGALTFFIPLLLLKDRLCEFLPFTSTIGRNIANFHTLFNCAVSLLILPFLNYFCNFTQKIYYFLYSQNTKKYKNCFKTKKVKEIN